MDTMQKILAIVCVIVVWVLYHKIFDVVYFDLGRGCIAEIFGCVLGGAVLAAIIMAAGSWLLAHWYITVPVIVAIIVIAVKVKNRY